MHNIAVTPLSANVQMKETSRLPAIALSLVDSSPALQTHTIRRVDCPCNAFTPSPDTSLPLLCRTISSAFSDTHKPTIGVDFHFRKFDISGVSVALQLWDIAGQDRFGAIYRVYYKDAFGAMLVFDLSRPETFTSVLKWKREIDSKVSLPNGQPLPVILLANKVRTGDAGGCREGKERGQ